MTIRKARHSSTCLPVQTGPDSICRAMLANGFRIWGCKIRIGWMPCTCTMETRYFSHRRQVLRGEKDYGRQISAITLTAK